MRSSDWQYLGTVFLGVGSALAVSGSVAFYTYQQGSLTNTRYTPYFLPILLIGIVIAVIGAASFFNVRQRSRNKVPPPPIPPPPPPPPP
jgi:hypothetical protein